MVIGQHSLGRNDSPHSVNWMRCRVHSVQASHSPPHAGLRVLGFVCASRAVLHSTANIWVFRLVSPPDCKQLRAGNGLFTVTSPTLARSLVQNWKSMNVYCGLCGVWGGLQGRFSEVPDYFFFLTLLASWIRLGSNRNKEAVARCHPHLHSGGQGPTWRRPS